MNDARPHIFSDRDRLESEHEEQTNQLAVLDLLAQTITSNLDLPHMLTAISEAVCHIFPGTALAIGTVNEDKSRIEFVMDFPGDERHETMVGFSMSMNFSSPITVALFQKQTPFVIANAETEPMLEHLQGVVTRFQIKTAVLLPLITYNDVLGVVLFYSRSLFRPFSPKDVAFARTIAGQIAGAIHHAKLFEQERRQRERAEILQDISMILSHSLDEETVLQKILEQVRRVIIYDASAIFLKTNDDLVLSLGANVPPRFLGRPVPLAGTNSAVEVFLKRTPLLLPDVELLPHWDKWEETSQIRNWIGVPLYVGDDGLGVLTVDYHQPGVYRDDDMRMLCVVGNHAALAIHNAQLYRQIHQKKQFFETLFMNSPVATVITDLDMRVTSWNPAAEHLFGYTAEEARGQQVHDLIVNPNRKQEMSVCTNSLKEGTLIRTIAQRQRKNGQVVEVELYGAPVMIEQTIVAYIGQYHDITELVQARKNSEAANRAKSAFLANMSHELRTPLTAILGFSELMQHRENMPPEDVAYLRTIHRNGEHLLLLLNNLLDLARLETGQVILNERDFNLYRMLEELRFLLLSRAEHEHVRLAFCLDPDVPRYVRTDAVKLHQVLLHLMSDILKITNQGEVELCVTYCPEDAEHLADGNACLSFEIVSRPLLPIRADDGLMPITRQFARLIGGELRVLPDETSEPSSLRFAFDIPVGIPHFQEIAADMLSEQHGQSAHAAVKFERINWGNADALPLQFWEQFKYATTIVDMSTMTACIRELRRHATEVADVLTGLQNDFDYVNMLTLIEQAKVRKGDERSS
ncbi:two-component hybrid sensor and regulator [Candidatus Moduliflexus flocculans]|uniref:histidine kinase n=1 Tax=Candidatus Moduliflexus flocculans TaxID=1499966 RepID=A0A0S6VPL5_9BACT|nr:two-component hybrid sensor and regulator [Candidatus Moduliflexus flocculans]